MREGTELLADEVVGILSDEQREVVAILNSSSRHLQQLIEQLLDYNRHLADIPIQKERIQLASLIDNVVLAHSLPAKAKGMKTECQLSVTECWAEPSLLSSVLDNLYSNAVHYGVESGKIWLSSQKAGAMIHIDVANTGNPIPAFEHTMIFEPFYQGSRLRKGAVKGSGLGLSIARDCIRRMQGELELISVDYADVCFRIKLPLDLREVKNNEEVLNP
jgi:two-component system, NtrC family, sensor histidine kinase GlrK